MVTVRRLILPEHTRTGRLPHQRENQVFQDADRDVQIQVPIEQLVIVARSLRTVQNGDVASLTTSSEDDDELVLPYSYSFIHDNYLPLANEDATVDERSAAVVTHHCHRCRRPADNLTECSVADCPLAFPGSTVSTRWCKKCLKSLAKQAKKKGEMKKNDDDESKLLPCCSQRCDCRSCVSFAGSELYEDLRVSLSQAAQRVQSAAAKENCLEGVLSTVRSMKPVEFALPHDFLDTTSLPIPQAKPSARVKARTPKRIKRSGGGKVGRPRTPTNKKNAESKGSAGRKPKLETPKNEPPRETVPTEDYSVFKPTCARTTIVYDPTNKSKNMSPDNANISSVGVGSEKIRNLRDIQERNSRLLTEKKDDSAKASSSSRAARANQRRLMKDVAYLGVATTTLGVDALASREPQLRFDRSGIHAWGVFADEDIAKGEMIVEYRGELIGNAVCERREVEYEAAKIGSDYMFRIDALNVCDATKQGNVARFLNASCDPNCQTKIITLDGTKRIVIYAKKDISVGDELCYDYKFPLEYDESKRIPCHCGAKDCRGFMNWVRDGGLLFVGEQAS